MKKGFMRNALGALSYVKKTYDECITSKTDDVDKRELIRDIVAIAVNPDTDFEGGEEEKFKTIYNKSKRLFGQIFKNCARCKSRCDCLNILLIMFFFLFCFVFFVFLSVVVVVAISWAAPVAYGGSQARG